jgi:hypothetical protein
MATRETKEQAQELLEKFQARWPNLSFRLTDESTSRYSQFGVYEVRACQDCGAEILTAAIGEDSINRCRTCKDKAARAEEEQSRQACAKSAERTRRHADFDEYSEPSRRW